RALAARLCEALAAVHAAGVTHPDLYAKHVLVGAAGVCFLDWARARRRWVLGWERRWRDLAALDATLADDLASPRERLACLRAYLRRQVGRRVPGLAVAARAVRRHARRLLA